MHHCRHVTWRDQMRERGIEALQRERHISAIKKGLWTCQWALGPGREKREIARSAFPVVLFPFHISVSQANVIPPFMPRSHENAILSLFFSVDPARSLARLFIDDDNCLSIRSLVFFLPLLLACRSEKSFCLSSTERVKVTPLCSVFFLPLAAADHIRSCFALLFPIFSLAFCTSSQSFFQWEEQNFGSEWLTKQASLSLSSEVNYRNCRFEIVPCFFPQILTTFFLLHFLSLIHFNSTAFLILFPAACSCDISVLLGVPQFLMGQATLHNSPISRDFPFSDDFFQGKNLFLPYIFALSKKGGERKRRETARFSFK